ncbi:MAG: carbamoyltransferase C-terminal domain-containing protein [Bacteroidota bacterium]
MYILGIGGSNHDFSAALVKDGKLLVAIEDERIQRIKHGDATWKSLPCMASINYCLEYAKISISEVDEIYANSDLENTHLLDIGPIKTVNHHLCHASSSYFLSPFKESTLLVADGCGEPVFTDLNKQHLETISIGKADIQNVRIETIQSGTKFLSSSNWTYRNSNSLGVFYKIVSEALGFDNRGEGKTMGLAAYGNPSLVKEMKKFVGIHKDLPFEFNPYNGIYDWLSITLNRAENKFITMANIAFAAQAIFEEALLNIADLAFRKYKSKNLSYSGGCALNCSANRTLKNKAAFDNVFIYPPAGDNGLAIGAALYGNFIKQGKRNLIPVESEIGKLAYTGKSYDNSEIKNALKKSNYHYSTPENSFVEIATRITSGEIIALFNGRSEIGPRALGNRSIVANPFSENTRDYINLKVKNRESFRPLAPMVLEEDVSIYFEEVKNSYFMLEAVLVKKEFRNLLRAVTHFDGTARIQVVNKNSNYFAYNLLIQYKKMSGHGILLNTSFNLRGEPIVESPKDALNCFEKMAINTLFLSEFLVTKHTPWSNRIIY